MEYKGYVYEPFTETEYDDDGRPENEQIYHRVRTPDGKLVNMDWSAYDMPTPEEFALWVELGLPDRFSLRDAGGPLDHEDLIELNNKRQQGKK